MSEEELIVAKGREVAVNIMGMTLRDYFAAQALASIAAHRMGSDMDTSARVCYMLADAMLLVRDK